MAVCASRIAYVKTAVNTDTTVTPGVAVFVVFGN
jgi:hypothetical protein